MKKTSQALIAIALCFTTTLSAFNSLTVPEIKETSPLFIKKKSKLGSASDGGDRTSQSVVKMNLSQLVFRNLSFQYEYGFHKNMSVACGFSYVMPLNIPDKIFTPSSNGEGYTLPKFKGWAITPEFRFYPGAKEEHQAPHGFYIAPYFRYSKYTLTAGYNELLSNNTLRYYDVKATFGAFTGGGMIGSQWILGKHFSIDFWIIGGGAGKGKLTLSSSSNDPTLNLSQAEQDQLKTDIQDNLGELNNFSNGKFSVETTSNSAKVTVKGIPWNSFRALGFCLGFAF